MKPRPGSLDDVVDGPLCPNGCGVPTHRVNRVYSNILAPPYHTCPRNPVALAMLAADRQDAALRREFGDRAVDEMREWIEVSSHWGDQPLEWANKRPAQTKRPAR